jgi:hypothetical protein
MQRNGERKKKSNDQARDFEVVGTALGNRLLSRPESTVAR